MEILGCRNKVKAVNFIFCLLNIRLSFLKWFKTLTLSRELTQPWCEPSLQGAETSYSLPPTQGLYSLCPPHFYQVPFLHLGTVRHTAKLTCPTSLPGQPVDLNSQPLSPKFDALPMSTEPFSVPFLVDISSLYCRQYIRPEYNWFWWIWQFIIRWKAPIPRRTDSYWHLWCTGEFKIAFVSLWIAENLYHATHTVLSLLIFCQIVGSLVKVFFSFF